MKKSIILISALIFSSLSLFAQEEKISPYVTLQYYKNNGDTSYLKTILTYTKDRIERPIPGLKITVYSGDASGKILTGAITDEQGIVKCDLAKDGLEKDENGLWQFTAAFEGNDTIEASSAELSIKDASLEMTCTNNDSIRTISLHAEKLENGKMVPAAGEYLTVYVPRMFSMLPVGEVTFDDNGDATVEFPSDLPGDIEGNVRIVAKFEEHPEFGTIEKSQVMKWGMPFIATDHSSRRALWTKTAPKWMIYTLTILLTGVWGHYLFTIISLIRIRIDAKRSNFAAENKSNHEIFIK